MPDIQDSRDDNIAGALVVLTARERQIAKLVCEGLSNKSIARTLNVSEGTIKSHLHNIFRKLGVQSRYELLVASDVQGNGAR